MLNNPQTISFEKLRARGSSPQDKGLTEDLIRFIIGRTALDLHIDLPNIPPELPEMYSSEVTSTYIFTTSFDASDGYEKLLTGCPDAETYIACMARILRARLKHQLVLETQALPTMDQVGPRSLLQYGTLNDASLASLIVWRKWLFDVDNRAAQDTGYLFEPVIAGAIGGVPYGHKTSPVRRLSGKGARQVDAIKGNYAYEFKIRITIAASGQGRWKEELDFPVECEQSGYSPVLVVLDPTPNPKLKEISEAYLAHGGLVYIGEDAWGHLRDTAGETMASFLSKYVEEPLRAMVAEEHQRSSLLPFSMSQQNGSISLTIGSDSYEVRRAGGLEHSDYHDLPEDSAGFLPGIG